MSRRKLRKKNAVILLLFIISFCLLIVSIFGIIKWAIDNKNTKVLEQKIVDITNVVEVDDNSNTEIISPPEEVPKSNPYWDYVKMNLINVDFNDLKKLNNDVVGWIQVNGTNINYPYVQTGDNDYYLKHSIDKKANNAGWVFMDYRNDSKHFGKNTILYAHGRVDGAMFGSLKNIMKSNWYNDINNHVVKLSTEYENTLWQVFSVYHIPTTNDYIKTDFSSDTEFNEWVNMLKARSNYEFDTNVYSEDKILTLSTCLNESEKVVLHAKLIKKEIRVLE